MKSNVQRWFLKFKFYFSDTHSLPIQLVAADFTMTTDSKAQFAAQHSHLSPSSAPYSTLSRDGGL